MFKKFQYKIFTLVNRMSLWQLSVKLLMKQTARVRFLIMTVFLNNNLYFIIVHLLGKFYKMLVLKIAPFINNFNK